MSSTGLINSTSRSPLPSTWDCDDSKQYIALRQGNLVTKKKELTILLVGETGVGKTTFFTMVTNILEGRDPSNYRVAHDFSNEVGGSKQGSQTNTARLYEFTSVNGVKVRLLDTPGFADTRGIEYDRRHKASIAKAIRDAIPSIDGVLFMANGTTERLQLATDYAITTLSSIFPHSIASNICLLFTMISNPMAFNFRMESLPDSLQEAEMFNLDNPIALRRKYEEVRDKPKNVKQAKALKSMVDNAHDKAVEMLAEFFDWLDECEAQPTTAIVRLFQNVCEIDEKLQNALASMNSIAGKKKDLEKIRTNISQSEQLMRNYAKFETTMNRTVKVQTATKYHNTLCGRPDCYSNCDINCAISFSLDPEDLRSCYSFGGGESSYCRHCHHPVTDHRHYHSIWEDKVHTQTIVDETARSKFEAALNDRSRYQVDLSNTENTIRGLDGEIMNAMNEVGVLCQKYNEFSLSGSFAAQILKTIRLSELHLETLQANGAATEAINAIAEKIKAMRQEEGVVKNAEDAMKRKARLASGRQYH